MSDNERDDFEKDSSTLGVPDAPAPKPKAQENLPDWARITSSLAEEAEEIDADEEKAVVSDRQRIKGFGSSTGDLSEEELFLDDSPAIPDETLPKPAAQSAKPYVEAVQPIKQETPAPAVAQPVQSNSRTIPEYTEDEFHEREEPVTSSKPSRKALKMPAAKAKPVRPVKSSKKVRKAVASGLLEVESDILAPRGRMAGNRWKLIALRTAVWGTLGMVVLTGIFAIVGPKGPNLSTLTTQVLSNLNRNNFPIEAGQQVASRFIKEYLSYTPGQSKERSDELENYIIGTGTAENAIISITTSREQRVIGEPVLAIPVELISDNNVVYTFAIQVFQPAVKKTEDFPALKATEPTWIYLAVPMSADEEGAVGVSGMPAFVPQPKIASGGEAIRLQEDTEVNSSAKPQIEKFLLHWAGSDIVSLKPYILEDISTSAATAGLGGTLDFISLKSLKIEKLPEEYVQDPEVAITCSAPKYEAPCRDAYITVAWDFRGIELSNEYRLIVLFDGQNWRVVDIRGTNFGTIGG
jgi:hypothetical protein